MIYPIPESLQDTHDGDEWAIAAILGGRVVALRYISDVASEIEPTESAIKAWLKTNPIYLRELQALGPANLGVVGADGFLSKWPIAAWRRPVVTPGRKSPKRKALQS